MNWFNTVFSPALHEVINLPVFPNGKHTITFGMTIHLIVLLAFLFYGTGFAKRSIVEPVLAKTKIDVGVRGALCTLFSYFVLSVGVLIILDTAGIDVSAITVLAGALGLGISLSLQGIISNFMAGLIILIERPIRIGDRIEVGSVIGDIIDISLRTTAVLTPDNITVIIPNIEFISSHSGRSVRVQLPIVVDKNVDPDELTASITQIAKNHTGIKARPAPEVLFRSLGENTQTFILSTWTDEYAHKIEVLQSDLNYAISRHLRDSSEKAESGSAPQSNFIPITAIQDQPKPRALWQSFLHVGGGTRNILPRTAPSHE
jgi:small-conductance mechanosensitive channel